MRLKLLSLLRKQLMFLVLLLFCPGGLDLIIVPGLAFSPQGQRLGRGKGYYDTYLRGCWEKQGKRPSTVALAFKEQIYESIPVLETDELVDLVLYERQPS